MMAEEAEQNGSRGFPGLSLGDWGRGEGVGGMEEITVCTLAPTWHRPHLVGLSLPLSSWGP